MDTPRPHIAHLRFDSQWRIHTIEDHCKGVGQLASGFATPFGMSNWTRLAGLFHDRGKEKVDFQRYIRIASGFDPEAGNYSDKNHSFVGALLLHNHFKDSQMLFPNLIAGHHRGLYNIPDLKKKMDENVERLSDPEFLKDVNRTIPELPLDPTPRDLRKEDMQHLTRMLFSCLIDADRLDTESFMNPDADSLRGRYDDMATLRQRLDSYCAGFSSMPDTVLNRLRTNIQNLCRKAASLPSGFFELTVPTGGGKTISSVIWAVHHALAHRKKRIIVAIPFTSIIVQTAQTLRNIFGENNVVEHHSVVDETDTEEYSRSRLACENWDAPIVVTTNLQLFHSIFSNLPGKCRKLHSICDSVVILDEVQSLPLPFLQPIVCAMDTYTRLFSTSFLFCTASQPLLDGERKGQSQAMFKGLDRSRIHPIVPPGTLLHDKLRRAELHMPRNRISIEEVATRVGSHERVLCIANTRSIATKIFEALPRNGYNIHLSRNMCPLHISTTISEVRRRLAETDMPVRVVSTQLIEAGVDIDFPVVYRQLAGLDSLLQAAGRCNREGRLPEGGVTYVFDLEGYRAAPSLEPSVNTMKELLACSGGSDWLAPATMTDYYRRLYTRTDSFDSAGIQRMAEKCTSILYEKIAEKFRMIEDEGMAVIVNYGKAPQLVERLRQYGPSLSLARKLALHTVTIPPRLFKTLDKAGLIDRPFEGFHYLPLKEQYDDATGFKADNSFLEDTFVI